MKTLVLTVAVSLVAGVGSAQSLGEIAAKTAAAKKADSSRTQPIAKTYTDQDLKDVPPIAPLAEATPVGSTPQTDAAERKDLHDELYWRRRLSPLLGLKARYAVHYDQAVAELQRVTPPWPQHGDGHAIGLAQESVDFWQHALNEAQYDIDALKEEGRRAGALPGWFR